MKIRVTDNYDGTEIYVGDADEFLFNNDCDVELEIALNKLEFVDKVTFESFLGETYEIEKELDLIYD